MTTRPPATARSHSQHSLVEFPAGWRRVHIAVTSANGPSTPAFVGPHGDCYVDVVRALPTTDAPYRVYGHPDGTDLGPTDDLGPARSLAHARQRAASYAWRQRTDTDTETDTDTNTA